MITVSTTTGAEAQAMTDLLIALTPREWDWKVFLQGREFAARDRRAPAAREIPIRRRPPAEARALLIAGGMPEDIADELTRES